MGKGLLIPLVVSVAVHALLVGAAELFYSPDKAPAVDAPAVSYGGSAGAGDEPATGGTVTEQAGTTGGTISLETSDPRYRPYFDTLRRDIEKSWRTPSAREGRAPTGKLVIFFTLGRDGKLLEISVHKSSGERELDFSAVESIKSAMPFKPFPADIAEDRLSVKARFVYD